ncbi:MAG: alkyl hydroperoxide reductase subunit F [Bdellovibrionaceae bacterium]|nr:alkyl hydroperoxide reductase subunit F [Pseudobdellovibrionaceae bacterium]
MIDNDMIEQLKTVFEKLEGNVELAVDLSQHSDQAELLNLLEGVAAANPKITVTKNMNPGMSSLVPRFKVLHNGQPTGIIFTGIPGGHEFTSLILAILNSDHKGKMPDPVLAERIKRLKGPIRLRTFISLTCENCPDVVQALNQMAILNPHIEHEMIDGAYAQDDVKNLNIQGVPSVVHNSKLMHSGRINFLDLLGKLEAEFGLNEAPTDQGPRDLGDFDVVVVGGGPAGVSAAIYSVRKGLKTALITEKIGGQVQETRGIENLISVTYTEGPQLAGQLAQHLAAYPVQLLEHRRVKKVHKDGSPKLVELESNENLRTKSLIIATGAKWRELGIPGEKDYIGRGVAFCPHCDGPFYKGKKVAVIGGGNSGVEAAIDLSGIVREVVLIEYNSSLKADQILVHKLKTLSNVSVLTNAKTKHVHGDGQKVNALEYEDRVSGSTQKIDLDGVFVQIGLVPNSQFLKDVVQLTPYGEIVVDTKGRTSEKGIYAAGDVTTTPYKQIIIAMGEGAKAGLAAFEDSMLHTVS